MVSQAIKYASMFLPIVAVWLSLVLDLVPGFETSTLPVRRFLLSAPLIAIFAFGLYCLITLYLQVVRFRDRPDEAESLKKEIQEAKADLRRKGVKID